MKTVFVSLITLFIALPTMARTVSFSGGKFTKEKTSELQTTYKLKLDSKLEIKLTDKKASTVDKGARLNSEGGWQPEINDMADNTALVLEAIRFLADQNCSADHIAQGMATHLPEELAGATVDISSLSEKVKSCLSK